MTFDAFVRIDGIPGESNDDKHRDWIEIAAYTHHMSQPASSTASSVGGATAERVNHGTFDIVHLFDKASPKLYEACCTGRHIKEVVIEIWRAGTEKRKYMEIRLEQALISNVSTSGGGEFPAEVISFSYGKIKWMYSQQARDGGGLTGNVAAGWDLTANKTYA